VAKLISGFFSADYPAEAGAVVIASHLQRFWPCNKLEPVSC